MLKEVLWGERAPCMLQILDLSATPASTATTSRSPSSATSSLTSLDMRNIPSANTDTIYSFLGSFLLQDECACRLGFLSCDAFQITAEQESLTLLGKAAAEATAAAAAALAAAGAPAPAVGADGKEQATPAGAPGGPGAGARRASKDDEKKEEKKEEPPKKDKKGGGGGGGGAAGGGGPGEEITNPAVLMLLAGVLKFNSSLKSLEVRAMDLDDGAATNFHYALKENTTLEHFDISDNLVGSVGVSKIADAVRSHPALATFKVDGAALPVPQVRGARKTDTKIDVGDWGLGRLSGYAIGTIAIESQSLTEIDLKANALGADGASAVINGLGEAPVKTLDLTRNGLGASSELPSDALLPMHAVRGAASASDATAATAAGGGASGAVGVDGEAENAAPAVAPVPPIQMLSVSICQNLRSLTDLRMDENDLDCDAEELSALCKLRSLRSLTMDKNRLTALPVAPRHDALAAQDLAASRTA